MLRQREPRERDEKHLDYIRSLGCCVCGDETSTEAAHIRTASLENGKIHTGMSEKPSDKWAVPLCNKHHREQHTMNELEFWKKHGIDPFMLAMTLRRR
jgi:Protein of unknown function (DUF968)